MNKVIWYTDGTERRPDATDFLFDFQCNLGFSVPSVYSSLGLKIFLSD